MLALLKVWLFKLNSHSVGIVMFMQSWMQVLIGDSIIIQYLEEVSQSLFQKVGCQPSPLSALSHSWKADNDIYGKFETVLDNPKIDHCAQ